MNAFKINYNALFEGMWGHILLWSVVTSFLVYLVMGGLWVGLLKVGHKRWRFKAGAGLLFVLSAGWKMISKDAVACKIISSPSIYSTSVSVSVSLSIKS